MATNNDFIVKHGLTVKNTATIQSTLASTSTTTGALVVSGGAGIGKDLFVGGTINALNSATTALVVKSNINMVSPDAASTITIRMLNSDAISFSGNSGQLFSITDSMTGTIFAVNDISGVPSIEVYDTGEVRLAETFGYVSIPNSTNATSTTTGALRTTGGVGIGRDLWVGGTLYANLVSGTITTASSVSTVAQAGNASYFPAFVDANNATATAESLFTTSSFVINPSTGNVGIGTAAPAAKLHVASNGGRLIISQDTAGSILNGIDFYSYTGGSVGGLLFNQSTGEIRLNAPASYYPTLYSNGVERIRIDTAGNVGIGTTAPASRLHVSGDARITGITTVTNTTNATSTVTGAFQVAGGAGIGGDLYVGGQIVAQKLTIEYTTVTTTLVQTDDVIQTTNATNATSTTTGALIVSGGVGIGKDLWVNGVIYRNGISVGYGYTGSLGYTGSIGFTGSQGIQGVTGFTGSQGIQGVIGYTGSLGYTGSQGIIGFVGSRGYDGSRGFTGYDGSRGYTGSQGITGYDGSRGYTGSQGIQGVTGFTGSIGFTGSQGIQGVTGYTGSQGITGYTGSRGYDGSRGLTGYDGSRGFTGSQGIQGVTGFTGSIGFTGSQGIQGVIGYTGSLGYVGSLGYTGSIGYTGSTGQVNTVAQTANASYFPTFVDSNNASATAESLYTTSSFAINPNTGVITISGNVAISTASSIQSSGLSIQRVFTTNAVAGNIYLLGTWSDTEGTVALEIQVSSETSGNSGSSIYRWQGGFSSVGATDTYYRLFPSNEGRGHGDGADSGLNLNAWAVYVYRIDGYTYGIAVSVPAGRTSKGLVTTITELKRGMTFVPGANTAVSTWTTGTNVFSHRNLIVENLVTATSGFFSGTVTATNFVGAFSGTVTGAATQIQTTAQTANASYFPTFVDANNASAASETVFTTSSFAINPGTGNIGVGTGSPGAKLQIGSINTNTELLRLGVNYDVSRNVRGGVHWHDSTDTTGRIFTEYDGSMVSMGFGSLYNSGYNTATVMTIRGNGNVGVGTALPTSTVDVYGQQANTSTSSANVPTGTLRLAYAGGSVANSFGSSLVFTQRWNTGNATQVGVGQITGIKIAGDGNFGGGLTFWTSNATANNLAERLRIDSAGNVGIATISPESKLHVAGDARITGITTVTNTTAASSTTTGALQVVGGVGIGGNTYIGGNEVVTGTLQVNSTSANTGTNTSNAFYTAGGAWIDKTLVVGGDTTFKGSVVFQGTNTFVYSSSTVYTDNLISLHAPSGSTPGSHTWTVDDGKDIGFMFHYYKGADKDAFLGFANDTQYLEWYSEGTESGGIFTGTTYGTFKTGGIRLVGGDSNSGNTTTGALQVSGGVGISGGLFVGGTVTATNFVGAFSGTITGSASQVNTIQQASSSTYYPVFVDSNNASSTGEIVYTTSSFVISPARGNVGFGVIPSNWGGIASNVLEFKGGGHMFGVAADNYFSVGSNAWYDGTNWRYKVGGKTATMYHQDTGRHEFFSAPSGTADAIISGWVNRFQINDTGGIAFGASGNGTTGQLLSSNGVNAPSWLSTSSLVVGTATTATRINTVAQTVNASYYPTFVDSNNASATGELVYTTSSFVINPSTGVVSINSGVVSTNTGTGALIVNGGVGINGALNAITKSFNIGHPTKPGMSLRYGSLEGPEFGVYVRGRLKGSNTIELPEYWSKLVNSDSITVNLTPVGSHQKLYVEEVVGAERIIIGNENLFGKTIDCYYTVYAERADIDPLVVEG